MRDDMAKVIVERPRRRGGLARKGRALPLEQLPSCEGMRKPHVRHYRGKELDEHLTSLRRYLDRQVGRPWRKVFAEISTHLRGASTVAQHVRNHVKDFVALKPRREINGFRHRAVGLWAEDFYVDPEDGLLNRTADLPALRRQRRLAAERLCAPRPLARIVLGSDRELRRIGGIWYELRHIRPSEDTPEAMAAFRRRHGDLPCVTTKRQLDRRTLHRFALANDGTSEAG